MATKKKAPKPKRDYEREAQHGKWVSRLVRWGELIRSIDLVMERVNRAANEGLITEESAQSALGELQDAKNELYSSGIP